MAGHNQNGLNMDAYFDDEGADVGTWESCNDLIEDLTVNQTRNTAKIKNRGSGEEKTITGQRVRSIDLTLTHDPTNTFWQACRDNFESDDPTDYIGFCAMDNELPPASGADAEGLKIDVVVVEFSQPQPLEEGSNWKVKLEPAFASPFEPAHVTVSTA